MPLFLVRILSFMTLFFTLVSAHAAEVEELKIYLDADRSNHIESAKSIEMGIRTAFSEIDNEVQGRKVTFVIKDHKGNALRSKSHMQTFKNDGKAIAIFAGMHSPPLIKFRKYIHENEILTMVPWAAGGPITRYPDKNNWVFRLSIDDTKAGYRMAGFAVKQKSCKKPHLILEKTPWGKSNEKTMKKAFKELLGYKADVTWFNWNTKKNVAKIKLRKVITDGHDCILFVGNAIEGAEFSKAAIELNAGIPFISHWGITGGRFHEIINSELRKKLDLSFIQSCFSFVSSKPTSFSKRVFAKAQGLFPEIKSATDIPAPTGFIHAYDLGKLMIAALQKVKLGDDMDENRKKLRLALENLKSPIQGLVKTYKKPFREFSQSNQDAHEALGLDDFCMGQYGDEDQVIVLKN